MDDYNNTHVDELVEGLQKKLLHDKSNTLDKSFN